MQSLNNYIGSYTVMQSSGILKPMPTGGGGRGGGHRGEILYIVFCKYCVMLIL